jgi:uncharacterized glyoxalase superfamily protein PhnB
MLIEHFAVQVAFPTQMADWYGRHLGLSITRHVGGKADTHFLCDSSGRVLLEIYNNPAIDVPDYASMHPLYLHLAFISEDVEADCKRLVEADASVVDAMVTTPAGDRLAMLRDPWGFAIQLCCRATAM